MILPDVNVLIYAFRLEVPEDVICFAELLLTYRHTDHILAA
jgi:hypothetical protein